MEYRHHVYLFFLFVNQEEDQILLVDGKPILRTADDSVFGDSSRIREKKSTNLKQEIDYREIMNFLQIVIHSLAKRARYAYNIGR